jgi:hypothetical protein
MEIHKRIIFLDIDGVLNSWRNAAAFGAFPFPDASDELHGEQNLDNIAIGMVRALCKEFDAKIVLHSMWRRTLENPIEFGKRHNLPIIDITHPGIDKVPSILLWMQDHPGVQRFVILDDDDIFWGNRDKPGARHAETLHIRTNMLEGMTLIDFANAWLALAELDISEVEADIKRRGVLIARKPFNGEEDRRTQAEIAEDEAELAGLTENMSQGRRIVELLLKNGTISQ